MNLLWRIESNFNCFQKISWVDFLTINPEIYLCLIISIGLTIVGTSNFRPQPTTLFQKKEVGLCLYAFTKKSLFIALIFYVINWFLFENTLVTFNYYTITDYYTTSLKFSVILTTLIILHASEDYVRSHPRHLMEYPLLILFTTVFLLVLISSFNFMTLFLAVIGFSLSIYVLLLSDSFNHSSREAGIKYYYLSTFSSGLLLSGVFFSLFNFSQSQLYAYYSYITYLNLWKWVWNQKSFTNNYDLFFMFRIFV